MLTETDTLHGTRNSKFLDSCYRAGQEWAEHAHEHGKHSLEDGLSQEFWSHDADDYCTVAEVAEEHGLNFRMEYQLRQAGLERLYAGCIERWSQLFKAPVKRFTKEEVVKAAVTHTPAPVTFSEPHIVSAPVEPVRPVQVPVVTKVSGGPTIISGKKIVILQKR